MSARRVTGRKRRRVLGESESDVSKNPKPLRNIKSGDLSEANVLSDDDVRSARPTDFSSFFVDAPVPKRRRLSHPRGPKRPPRRRITKKTTPAEAEEIRRVRNDFLVAKKQSVIAYRKSRLDFHRVPRTGSLNLFTESVWSSGQGRLPSKIVSDLRSYPKDLVQSYGLTMTFPETAEQVQHGVMLLLHKIRAVIVHWLQRTGASRESKMIVSLGVEAHDKFVLVGEKLAKILTDMEIEVTKKELRNDRDLRTFQPCEDFVFIVAEEDVNSSDLIIEKKFSTFIKNTRSGIAGSVPVGFPEKFASVLRDTKSVVYISNHLSVRLGKVTLRFKNSFGEYDDFKPEDLTHLGEVELHLVWDEDPIDEPEDPIDEEDEEVD